MTGRQQMVLQQRQYLMELQVRTLVVEEVADRQPPLLGELVAVGLVEPLRVLVETELLIPAVAEEGRVAMEAKELSL
jgi:hypothetical protein